MFSTRVQISAILNSEDLLLTAILSPMLLLLFFIPPLPPSPCNHPLLALLANINLTTLPAARDSPRQWTRDKYFTKSIVLNKILLRKVQFWEDYCAEPISYFQFILDMVTIIFVLDPWTFLPQQRVPWYVQTSLPSALISPTILHLGCFTFDQLK